MLGPLTYLDAGLLAITALSGLLAMYRGLTRELLSILSWIIAAGAVAYVILFQKALVQDLATQVGVQLPIAQIGFGAVLFLIVLIVVHLVTSKISDTILDSRVGMIDRLLGFAFGVARGFVLVVIPFMFLESFFPDAKAQPVWVREAKTLPMIKSTGNSLKGLLLKYVPNSLTPPTDQPIGQQQGQLPAIDTEKHASRAVVPLRHISVADRDGLTPQPPDGSRGA
jgi:membrane protein required for colicin V production